MQSTGSKSDAEVPGTSTLTGVTPSDVVISINGFCNSGLLVEGRMASAQETTDQPRPQASEENSVQANPDAKNSAPCKTEVTRAQFESLIDALAPGMDTSNRIRTAVRYPEILLFAQKARELGIEHDQSFQERAKYSYLQLLSQSFTEYLTENAKDIGDAEVEQYYKEHPETFEQVNLSRIFVPKQKKHSQFPTSPEGVEKLRAADEATMRAEAVKIRTRAVAGVSFEKLEAEVYGFAGYSADEIPDVDLGLTTRAEMPEEYRAAVFNLKTGEVSQVIPGTQGWHICKVLSRKTIPLSQAKELLVRLRIQEAINSAKSSVQSQYNDAYFNTPKGMQTAASAK